MVTENTKGVSEAFITEKEKEREGLREGEKLKEKEGVSFLDLYGSNFFDGADSFAFIKAIAPIEVLVGLGVLAAVFLPKILGLVLAGFLLFPYLLLVVLRSVKLLRNPQNERVVPGRVTAKLDGDFCVLLIGARNNAPWKLTKKFGEVGSAFAGMFKELERLPLESSGYMGGEIFFSGNFLRSSHTLAVVYWRSYDHLIKYSHSPNMKHVSAWRAVENEVRNSTDLGIWHEAFQVVGGKYDSIYVNCPPIGLGMANPLVPCVGHLRTSRGRTGTPKPLDSEEPPHLSEEPLETKKKP